MTRTLPYATAEERAAARDEVAGHLAADGIVVYPTETVYGLGCALRNRALRTLAELKGDRPFLILIRDRQDAPGLRWTDDAERLAEAFWPGPLTLALRAEADTYPGQVVGPDGAVAVRVSPHPAIPDLLNAAAGPVTSTSANLPGGPPARDGGAAANVGVAVAARGASVLVLDGGGLPEARPSTIVWCGETNRLLREGALPRSTLERVVSLT